MSEGALARRATTEAPLAFEEMGLPPAAAAAGARITCLHAFEGGLHLGLEATAATGSGGAILRLDLRDGSADEVVVLPPPDAADLAAWRAEATSLLALAPLDPDRAPVGAVTGLAVVRGTGDDHPCLYATTASLRGGALLRSENGLGYMRAWSQPRQAVGLAGLGCPAAWEGQLALVSFGPAEGDELRLLPTRAVLVSADPARGPWAPVAPPGFGDPLNEGVAATAAAFGRLHVATRNPRRGFQVWAAAWRRSDKRPDPWAKALDGGAHRFAANPAVSSMAAFGNQLFVGTASEPDGLPGLAMPAAELLRVGPDGTWEVVAGELRASPAGLKVPLSVAGPGLGDRRAGRVLVAAGPDHVVAASSTGHLLVSQDGEDWDGLDTLARVAGGAEVSALAVVEGDVYAAAGGRLLRAALPG